MLQFNLVKGCMYNGLNQTAFGYLSVLSNYSSSLNAVCCLKVGMFSSGAGKQTISCSSYAINVYNSLVCP